MASALTHNNKKQRYVRERINDFAHFSTHNKKKKKKFYIKLWRKFGIYRVKSDDDYYGYE